MAEMHDTFEDVPSFPPFLLRGANAARELLASKRALVFLTEKDIKERTVLGKAVCVLFKAGAFFGIIINLLDPTEATVVYADLDWHDMKLKDLLKQTQENFAAVEAREVKEEEEEEAAGAAEAASPGEEEEAAAAAPRSGKRARARPDHFKGEPSKVTKLDRMKDTLVQDPNLTTRQLACELRKL